MRAPLLLLAIAVTAWATLIPGPDLASRINGSDAILVATVRSGTTTCTGERTRSNITLHVHRVLKGSAIPGTQIAASLEGRGLFLCNESSVNAVPPLHGIWYLKSAAAGFEVVPRAPNLGELYLTGTWLPEEAPPGQPGKTTAESVSNEIVSALRWLATAHGDELKPATSIESVGGQRVPHSVFGKFGSQMFSLRDELRTLPDETTHAAYRTFARESSPHLRSIGLAGLIALNDPEGPKLAATDLKPLSETTDVTPIVQALMGYYNASDPAAVRAIANLATSDLAIPQLQQHASYVLRVLHTRDTMPALIALLDSDDAMVRANALSGICLFIRNAVTVTPDAARTMSWMSEREPTPFRTADTDRYCWMGGSPEEAKATELVAFWKTWWLKHAGEVTQQ